MGNDAAAMEVDSKGGDEKRQEEAEETKKPVAVIDLLCQSVFLLEEAVSAKETNLCMGRLLRQTAAARKRMNEGDIVKLIRKKLPKATELEETLAPFLEVTAMELDENDNKENLTNGQTPMATGDDPSPQASTGEGASAAAKDAPAKPAAKACDKPAKACAVPECEMYVYLLAIMKLLDGGSNDKARALSAAAVERLGHFNRRTMDSIAARIYAYFSWSHERCGDAFLKSIRSKLLQLQRTAILRHDEVGQETLLNLLLHNYLHFSLYDHAEKLRSKTQLNPTHRNMHQFCRYLYYVGRIRAIQLDYTESKENLQQALRKAPAGAKDFRITLHKWICMVLLLLGEIPERTHFTTPGMRKALKPYFNLTQAIRKGDLKAFQQVAQQHWEQFLKDKTHNLIVRLQHNVIRTGLRNISKAYSRISLRDVAQMLGLESGGVEEVECIVAKAVRDGAIDAKIDHTNQWMTTSEASDVYSTFEPQQAFHSRIMFCLNLHNEAVKAMRYKPNEHKESAETEEARKERLQQEQELASALQEEDEF